MKRLSAPPLRVASLTCVTSLALLGTSPAPAADEPVPAEQEVIVTGTRETTRTAAQSLAPIAVISSDELTKSGIQSARDLVSSLVPSIDTSSSGAGASFALKTVALRGLSGDQTLVLVNGKRRHDTSVLFINGTTQNGQTPPDLDLIPVSAIDHVEVLLDGASAQYGSDAIAGVINIILKKSADATVPMLYGTTADGGGDQWHLYPDGGFGFGDGGYLHLSADGRLQDRTDRGTLNTSQLYFPVDGQPDPREATADRHTNHPGQPQVRSVSLAYNLSMPVGRGASLYSFSTLADRDSNSWLTYRNPSSSMSNEAVFPNGYSPQLLLKELDFQAVLGIKGSNGLLGLDWDLSTTLGRDAARLTEPVSLNASMGPDSPSSFYIGRLTSTEWTTNLDGSRHFDTGLFAAPLFAAGGLEYRRNTYQIGAGEPASYIDGGYRAPAGPLAGVPTIPGSEGVTGFPPGDAGTFTRSDYAAYLNFEQRLTSAWELDLAGRYEDYSDAGHTITGKLSTRFEPVKGFAIRGTVSNGFRAPTLAQEHYASSSTIGVQLVPGQPVVLYPVSALPVDSPAAIALGARPLVPEKSVNTSLGFVLQPAAGVTVTLDAYQIRITDRILLTGTLIGPAVSDAFAGAGLNPAQGGFFFTNGADTTTRGLDLVAQHHSDLGRFGLLAYSLSANYNKTQFDSVEAPSPALAASGLTLISRQRQGDFTVGTPRDKEILGLDWVLGPVDANLRLTRYGTLTDTGTTPALDDTMTPKVLTDLNIDYALGRHLTLTLGANNLFNVYPNVLKLLNQGNTGFNYYNPYSPFQFSGGFYYGRITLHY